MPSKEQIEKWKKAYGEVYKITVKNEDQNGVPIIPGGKEEYVSFHKKLGNRTLSFASKQAGGVDDPIKFNEIVVQNTFLEGDEEIKQVDELCNAAGNELQSYTKEAVAASEKL